MSVLCLQGPCIDGKTVALREGQIFTVGYDDAIAFEPKYKNIILKTTDCDDRITIVKTYPNASSLKVFGYGGNDRVIVGDGSHPLDTLIFANLTIDGGLGTDKLKIHDEGSLVNKSVIMHYPTVIGVTGNSTTFSYHDFEDIHFLLGNANMDVDVDFVGQDASLTLSTQGKHSLKSMNCHHYKWIHDNLLYHVPRAQQII